MYMKLKDGKSKVLTLSYDDGVMYDKTLIEILDKYGIKCTFNINTGLYSPDEQQRKNHFNRLTLDEAKALYTNSGHEVAVHALTHPFLEQLSQTEVMTEILEDRKNIEQQYGCIARGMAYPFGTYNDEVIETLKRCGICYSRTVQSTESFGFPTEWLKLHPTCHHDDPKLMELAKHFAEDLPDRKNDNWMFYLWGHSYEFNNNNNWNVIEEFAQYMGGREDIWYATNIEIYDYVMAYKSLAVSVDKTIVHNPSATDVWFVEKEKIYRVGAGETIILGQE